MPPQTDHDLLIRLDEKVDALHMKVGMLTDDHETRIRILETGANQGKGKERIIQGLVSAAIAGFIGYLTHR